MTDTHVMSLRLPEELHARLRWDAFAREEPMNAIIVRYLDAALPTSRQASQAMTARARAMYGDALEALAEEG